jgi:hypothetical protein
MTAARTLAFGDLETGAWGAAWIPPGATPILATGAGAQATAEPLSLATEADSETWRLESANADLAFEAVGGLESTDQPGPGSDRLCRVTGKLRAGGREQDLDCLGWRSDRELALERDKLDSVRLLSAWFDPDEAIALLSLRPRKARGQESDVISVALREPHEPGQISDPRLSTTYGDDGYPRRAGLELWIALPSQSEASRSQAGDEQAEQQFPRRLAGEAIGRGVHWTVDDLALHAAPFRCHLRERDGAGVYLLGTRK